MLKKIIGGLLLAAGLGVAAVGIKPLVIPSRSEPASTESRTGAIIGLLGLPLGAAGVWLLLSSSSAQSKTKATPPALTPAEASALCKGGRYEIRGTGGLEIPIFTFLVDDIPKARALLQDMYVGFDVRFDATGQLAFHLEIPDRKMTPWSIPIAYEDLERLKAGSEMLGGCVPIVTDGKGESIDLKDFAMDITYDWGRAYCKARKAFDTNAIEIAGQLLLPFLDANPKQVPAAHHLFGRCSKQLGGIDTAIEYYGRAIAIAVNAMGTQLLPMAAGMLSDMGVAFKQKGDIPRAIHCLLHSLTLRPNHPEALLTFVTLFGQEPELIVYGLARVSVIDPQNALVAKVIQGFAPSLKTTPEQLRARVQRCAEGKVDLSHWPFAREEFKTYQSFKAGLDDASRVATKPRVPASALG
ncbi:MAG: tetratricopeptide repeat protein [Spirulina sp. SIO3F2]|nr:tetratricopeptide repeat protein [Spirulina sp. SIO3F2]